MPIIPLLQGGGGPPKLIIHNSAYSKFVFKWPGSGQREGSRKSFSLEPLFRRASSILIFGLHFFFF